MEKVIVFGGQGYIGSVVCGHLLSQGYRVVSCDSNIYGHGRGDERPTDSRLTLINDDFRDEDIVRSVVRDADGAVHLGGFVGEPACMLNHELTIETNLAAPLMAAHVSKSEGVKRFIFASTCSVYGTNDKLVFEHTAPEPLSLYAWTKAKAEEGICGLADRSFSTVALRLGTAYGISPRPRLDSVVNSMASSALSRGEIVLRGGGQWRPIVHVDDIAEAIRLCMAIPSLPSAPDNIINIGSNEQNYSISTIASLVHEQVPEARINRTSQVEDARDYRVNSDKAADVLGFVATRSIKDAVDGIRKALNDGTISDPRHRRYNNYEGLRAALDSGSIAPFGKSLVDRYVSSAPPRFQ